MKTSILSCAVMAGWLGTGCSGAATTEAQVPEARAPRIEQVAAPGEGILANAYLIETDDGVVVVDGLLRVSDARMLKARIEATHRPLRGIVLTHGHPDHYNGVATLLGDGDVPVIATAAVDAVIRAHDAEKEQQWRPMFGDEWPAKRAFPTRIVADGETVELAGVRLQVHDAGPAESHADSYWTLEGTPAAFIGDIAFSGTHAYMTDGHTAAWLALLARLTPVLGGATLYPGHGAPGGVELLAAQRHYIEAYRAAVQRLSPDGAPLDDAKRAQLVAEMKAVLPTESLAFLIGLGADPVAAELAGERR
jgi:glyoxylase-like metal-dependent hydrolase (beta-lactamase superfamily II)